MKTIKSNISSGYTIISQLGFYNKKEWKELRNLKISNNPLCEICYKEGRLVPAQCVDHIIPVTLENVSDKFYDYQNLQSLCNNCHYEKTHGRKTRYSKLEEGRKLKEELESD